MTSLFNLGHDEAALAADAEKPPPGQESGDVRPRRTRAANGTGTRSRTRATPAKSLVESQIAAMFLYVNAGIGIGARFGFTRHDDILTGDEIASLVEASTAEAMAHPKIAHWLETAGKVTPHVQMALALVMVALPRLINRGIIPPISTAQAVDATVPLEPRGTPFGGGGHRNGQEYATVAPSS